MPPQNSSDWVDNIIFLYDSSWSVFATVYATTWAFKIVKRVLGA